MIRYAIAFSLLSLLPATAWATPPGVLGARGILAYRAGAMAGAARLLSEAVQKRPEMISAAHHLGLALIRQGDLVKGRRVLRAAVRRDPGNARLLLDLGLAYLSEGNHVWAVRMLGRARDLEPKNGQVRHYLGVAKLAMGAADEAVPELEQAATMPHDQQQESSMRLGLALFRAKRFGHSRRLLASLGGTPHGAVARQLLRAAYEAEGIPASLLSVDTMAGFVADSNPLYMAELPGNGGVAPGISLSGRLTVRPVVDDRNMIWGDLSLLRTFYFGDYGQGASQPPDASPSVIGASAFYARQFLGEGRSFWLTAGYAFGLTFLDGESLTDSNHIFLESHGGQISLQLRRDGGPTTRLRYTLTRETYSQYPRNNWGNELAAEHDLSLLSGRLRLLLFVQFRHEAADADYYNAVVPGGGVGLSGLAPWGLVPGLRLAYEYENYYDSADSKTWDEHRVDHDLIVTVELGRALPWGLRARAVYQFFYNHSTVGTFHTDRHLFNLNLSWSY